MKGIAARRFPESKISAFFGRGEAVDKKHCLACFAPLVFVMIFAAALFAQEHPYVPSHPGSWQSPPSVGHDDFVFGFPAADRPAGSVLGNQLFAILRRMPEMAPPAGFEVFHHAYITFDRLDGTPDSKRPLYLDLLVTLNLAPYERTSHGVDGNERDTAGTVAVTANSLPPMLRGNGITDMGKNWQDADGQLMQNPPAPDGAVHGYPMYKEGNGDTWVVMRRNDVPFYAPVSRERYLRLFMGYLQEQLAKGQQTRAKMSSGIPASVLATLDQGIAQLQKALDEVKSDYAAMSPQQRSSPAILASPREDGTPQFADDASGGTAVVYVNPALMDSRLPRTAPQILAIRFASDEEHWPGMLAKLENQLDWAALDKLLHQ
jgi:hypothetical protein